MKLYDVDDAWVGLDHGCTSLGRLDILGSH